MLAVTALMRDTRPSATQAVMKCKVESPKKLSIPKNMFYEVSDPSFPLERGPFLGKTVRRERKSAQ